jgi:hypothetical protein
MIKQVRYQREIRLTSKGDLHQMKGSFAPHQREFCPTSKGDNFIKTASAARLLRRWIAHNSQLTTRLAEAGYTKNRHSYTPCEVRLIFI